MPIFVASAVAGAAAAAGGAYQANQSRKNAAAANAASAKSVEEANLFSAQQAAVDREFSSQQAERQMQFQDFSNAKAMAFSERMASSQHQREVADLKAAGLNPILSGTGGMGSAAPSGVASQGAQGHSSAPQGRSFQAQAAQAYDPIGPAVSSAMSTALQYSEMKKKEAETAEVAARTPTYEVQMAKAEQEIRESASRVGLNTALEDKSVQEVNRIYSEIAKMAVDMDLTKAQTSESYSRIPANRALAGKYSAETSVSQETERSMVTDRYLRKKVGDIEKEDLPKPLAEIPLDLIKGLLFRFIK